MNLQNLSDQSLLNATEQLVREERELLTKILYHLHEIERRKLYCDKGFRSLFDFAVRGLGYSEDQAWRRIAAMKLLRELPELEVKITSGELSLSHLGLAHAAFRQEAKLLDEAVPVERKLNLISQIAAKPIREAERVTAAWSSSPAERVRDQVRTLGVDRVELRFEASLEVREKLATLKGYLAHEAPDLSLGELLDRLCELGLKHWRPSAAAQAGGTRAASLGLAPKLAKCRQDALTASQEGSAALSKSLPAALSKSSPATSRESCVNQSPQDREPTPRRHQSQ
ncbi:MAG: hypothetical protein IT288_11820, partial [Bdellovibrionales bacterium]|nr:hypothetical protein [Bdellovibrionales bacterium]